MICMLFSDIEGSTQKWQRFPDRMPGALSRHDAIIRECVANHGGEVVKHTGDGFFAVFDGGDPLGCALEVQRALQAGDWSEVGGLRVRIGLHAGEVERSCNDYFGQAVSKASRIMSSAWGGQVVVSDAVIGFGVPDGASIEDLGLHMLRDLEQPVHLYRLTADDLELRDFPPLRTLSMHRHNLPAQTTPFIGREQEVRATLGLIRSGERLVTLIGPGGIGKTRLGVQTAAEAFERFSGGVFFVPLDRLDSPDFILPAIAESIGFSFYGGEDEKAQLEGYMCDKQLLLVLDNFEHVISGAPLVSELLEAARGLGVLVTSREALNVSGERLVQLSGLELPDSVGDPRESEAVTLFLLCASRVGLREAVTGEDLDAVMGICRMLDGQPLGIELAAAWSRTLRPREILEEIGRNVDFLSSRMREAPERHRSLRAVFDYSWALLTEEEREALKKLSVFRGGLDREAARVVAEAGPALLAGLVDKSLLRCSHSGRFDMLYILREYAGRKLAEDQDSLFRAEEAHCRHYSELLRSRAPLMRSMRESEAIADVALEFENVRAAWEWAAAHAVLKLVVETAEGLDLFCERRGWFGEACLLFGRALETLGERADRVTLSVLRRSEGVFLMRTGRIAEARDILERSLAVLREQDLCREIIVTLVRLGDCRMLLGDLSASEEALDEGVRLSRDSGDRFLLADALL
ncbi:hypothetical protein JW921_06680, partial [Candidatus Fermentibacterales bacterium]|nr:hypothetical protein [Candidatus Fermentibacterales bacterium]